MPLSANVTVRLSARGARPVHYEFAPTIGWRNSLRQRFAAERVNDHQVVDAADDRRRHSNLAANANHFARLHVHRRAGDPQGRRFNNRWSFLRRAGAHLQVQRHAFAIRRVGRKLNERLQSRLRMIEPSPADLQHTLQILAIAAGKQVFARRRIDHCGAKHQLIRQGIEANCQGIGQGSCQRFDGALPRFALPPRQRMRCIASCSICLGGVAGGQELVGTPEFHPRGGQRGGGGRELRLAH